MKVHKNKLYHLGIKQNVHISTLSRVNEVRDWRIFADFGEYLIPKVRPLYANHPIPNIDIDNEVFAFGSTSISVSINLLTWTEGKYSRGAVKIHTLLNLRGNIPEFILITDGKYHDSNALDILVPITDAIYIMDRAYVDFDALFRINQADAFFVTRAKSSIKYEIKSEYSIYEIMQILSISVFDKNPIKKLLTEQRQFKQDDKELLLF